MDVIVLAAGYGTRLYPLTKNKPKALLPVAGRPIIDYTLDVLRGMKDLRDVYVVCNEKFYPQFLEWRQQKSSGRIEIVNDHSLENDSRLGAIGDLAFCLERREIDSDVLVFGADNIWQKGLEEFIGFAKKKSPNISIGVYDLGDKSKAVSFGVVELDSEGRILSFEEKPENPKASTIGMCLYYFPSGRLKTLIEEYLSDEEMPRDAIGFFLKWLSENYSVYGYVFPGRWFDIGSKEAYEEANAFFKGRQV